MTWYVVRSATRQEKRAEAALKELGFAVYLPRLVRWQRLGKAKKRVESALFPGYLFVALEPPERFRAVLSADGVHAFVGVGGAPAPIDGKWVDLFRQSEARGDYDKTRRPATEGLYRPGQEVKVGLGRFADWTGTVVQMTSGQRVEVLLHLFGRNHLKTLHVDNLHAA